MNETAIDLDRTDEEILTRDVSDEALEAAAGTVEWGRITTYSFAPGGRVATVGDCGCAGEGSMSWMS